MNNSTNSCKHLYSILKAAYDEDREQHATSVWAKVLGADASSKADICVKLIDLMDMIQSARDYIKSVETFNSDRYLNALNRIQLALMDGQLINTSWGNIKARLSEDTIDLVDACGDLLIAQGKGFREISPTELKELQQQIRDLQDEIINSDIDSETKQFLINELRKIEDAILNYRVRGASGIVQVSEEVTGKTLIKGLQLFDKAREMAGKVINFAIKANSLASVGERLHNLPEGLKDLTKFLLPGNGN